jgi:uncharacterized phage protein gp47/JayE
MTTLACTIGPSGISAPDFNTILSSLQASFQSIFGSDIYIDPDSQDGQQIAIFAQAISDSNNATIATFNSFSPGFAQGEGLSSVVKINGIRRLFPSFSTAVGTVVGIAGTVITNGVVVDTNGNQWTLPAVVTIPGGGSISVTVTAANPGNIVAPAGSISQINTPTRGWQTFTSTADAAPGNPVETDAALRQRQAVSTSLPAETPLQALLGALSNLSGVGRVAVYENATGTTDVNGLPEHSISAVVSGGNVTDIVTTIGQKKTPGARTYGTSSGTYADPVTGIITTINYNALTNDVIKVAITGTAGNGYSTLIAAEIQNAVAAYINSLAIGQDVQFTRINAPAYLNGAFDGLSYEITGITIALGSGSPGTVDIPIAYNAAATCIPSNVTIAIS